MADPLVLINAFEVPREDAEQFIAAWEKTRDYLSAQPGYVDTALHQAVTPNADFQFVNIGRWQTLEDFHTATQSPGFRSQLRAWPGTGRIPVCTGLGAPERLPTGSARPVSAGLAAAVPGHPVAWRCPWPGRCIKRQSVRAGPAL